MVSTFRRPAGTGRRHRPPTPTAGTDRLGVVPVSIVPVGMVVALVVGVLVVANLLALGPAIVAARSKPGRLLRAQ